jgi:hypothetical protein
MTVEEALPYLREHQKELTDRILRGKYTPSPVRRVEIPKADGGVRKLGIPTVIDRTIQQSISQQLMPIYEPLFIETSYGYRPNKSAKDAILKVKEYAEQGYTYAVTLDLSKYFDTFENAAFICANACVTLSGALPLMAIVSRLLNKPMEKIGSKIGVNSVSAVALLATLVTNASTFGVMDKMNKKGVVLNSAFAVSAAFVFGSHLAFTMAFDKSYIAPMIAGKIISGVCSIVLAFFLYKEEKETV